MLKWYTNAYGRQIAIDNRHVTQVYEVEDGINKHTCVVTVNGTIQLKESILEVVTRLNAE